MHLIRQFTTHYGNIMYAEVKAPKTDENLLSAKIYQHNIKKKNQEKNSQPKPERIQVHF